MNPVGAALAYVFETRASVFITGKAGSGKTTLVERITQHCTRQFAVVAPTGVAALRAGGTTIHSLFKIPVGTIIPAQHAVTPVGMLNWRMLLERWRAGPELTDMLLALEVLFIDEVSMVRPDLLDAVDQVLRKIRNQPKRPFGGLQVVYVGDLFQLAPVYQSAEWQALKPYYSHPFFHASLAVQAQRPVLIHLTEVYRQQDPLFLSLLNQVRVGHVDTAAWELLQSRVQPSGSEVATEISKLDSPSRPLLTTHVQKAQVINDQSLEKLPGKVHVLAAEISGEFQRASCPAEEQLHLKLGARIMLLKNDTEKPARFFNGKLGWVEEINPKQLTIRFSDEQPILLLEQETWKQIQYRYSPISKRIEQTVIGTFRQFPVKLAWAITVHKSQGLTFDEVELELDQAFAAGQVYVALSRCRSLAGLHLRKPIPKRAIRTDPRLLQVESDETFQLPSFDAWEQAFLRDQLLGIYFADLLDALLQSWRGLSEVVVDSIPLWRESPEERLQQLENIVQDVHALLGSSLLNELLVIATLPEKTAATPTDLSLRYSTMQRQIRMALEKITKAESLVQGWELTAYNRELLLRTQDALRKFIQQIASLRDQATASVTALDHIFQRAADCWQRYQAGELAWSTMKSSNAKADNQSGPMQDEVVHVPQVTYPSRPVLIESTITEVASSPESSEEAALVSDPQQITRALLTFRLSMARSERVPAYRVMTNDMLYAIVRERPMELVELARIRGMGPKRLQAYGEQILAIVQGQHAFVPLEASQLPLSTHT